MIKNKKTIIIAVISILAISTLAVLLVGFFSRQNTNSNTVPPDSNYVDDEDQPLTDGTTPAEDKVIIPAPDSNTGTDDTETAIEKPVITRAELSGDNIRISAIFSEPSSGNCLVTIEKAGHTAITKTASIIVGPSYYTCNGFRIPRTELPASGVWTVTVTHQLEGRVTISDPKTLTLE